MKVFGHVAVEFRRVPHARSSPDPSAPFSREPSVVAEAGNGAMSIGSVAAQKTSGFVPYRDGSHLEAETKSRQDDPKDAPDVLTIAGAAET
jgi:hypothetical protein